MISQTDSEFRKCLTDWTQKKEEERWKENVERKPKLRTYKKVKTKLVFEPYLDINSRKARTSLTKLRSGTNQLRIERGRYVGEKVEERLCHLCNEVEDEEHFLTTCKLLKEVQEATLHKKGRVDNILRFLMGGEYSAKKEEIITQHILNSVRVRERFMELLCL